MSELENLRDRELKFYTALAHVGYKIFDGLYEEMSRMDAKAWGRNGENMEIAICGLLGSLSDMEHNFEQVSTHLYNKLGSDLINK